MGRTMNPISRRVDDFITKVRFSAQTENMRIGTVLLEKEIITKSQLERALEEQKNRLYRYGKPIYIGKIISDLGYATEKEIVEAVNEHYNLAVTSLTDNIEDLVRFKRMGIVERIYRPRIPIWLQLTLYAVFIIVTTVAAFSWVSLKQQQEQLYTQTVKTGTISLNYFTNNARIPLIEDNILRLNTLIKEATEVSGVRYAAIVDSKNQIKAHTNPDNIGLAWQGIPRAGEVESSGEIQYYKGVSESGENIMNLKRDIVFHNKPLGQVHVGVSLDFIHQMIKKRTIYLIGVASVILTLGILFAVLMGLRFSRPLRILVSATSEITKGNYQHRVQMDRNDEFGNLAMAFNRMTHELWIKSLMQQSFGKYVGYEVLQMIMSNPENNWLKGQKNDSTVLFTDIRGFTSFAESNEPEEVVEALNEYFEIASKSIVQYGGYIDKFIGDAVLGVFGVPIYHKNHVWRAVRAAVDMQKIMREKSGNGNRLLSIVGIGINTGISVSGNIGSQTKMEYTVIGDSVNVASRINGLAGPGEIIVSKSVVDVLGDALVVETLEPQEVKGKSQAVETFKVIELKEIKDEDTCEK